MADGRPWLLGRESTAESSALQHTSRFCEMDFSFLRNNNLVTCPLQRVSSPPGYERPKPGVAKSTHKISHSPDCGGMANGNAVLGPQPAEHVERLGPAPNQPGRPRTAATRTTVVGAGPKATHRSSSSSSSSRFFRLRVIPVTVEPERVLPYNAGCFRELLHQELH